MIVQCFLFVFFFVLYHLPMCYSATQRATSGPFKTTIVSVNNCRNLGKQYSMKPPMILNTTIQNIEGKNTLSGNLTVLKDTRDVNMKIKSYTWRDGKWRQSHSFNNLDCHGALLHFTYAACNIKYDKRNCMFYKGFYSFNNMDINKLHHIWVGTSPYGRLLWRSETYNNGKIFICKEFETATEPAFFLT